MNILKRLFSRPQEKSNDEVDEYDILDISEKKITIAICAEKDDTIGFYIKCEPGAESLLAQLIVKLGNGDFLEMFVDAVESDLPLDRYQKFLKAVEEESIELQKIETLKELNDRKGPLIRPSEVFNRVVRRDERED